MRKLMTVEMPDGSKWGMPVSMIAQSRATYYASDFDGHQVKVANAPAPDFQEAWMNDETGYVDE